MRKPVRFPNAEQFIFKPKFIEQYSALTDWEEFKYYSLCFLRKSIRVNTLKISIKDLKERLEARGWELEQVPWCEEGFWIYGERRDIGNLPEHILGYIYVQEAASMIPPVVLDPQPGEKILDMCAAPGSKTTQIGSYMKNEGVLIANDSMAKRLASLGVNVQRCGLKNAIITNMLGHLIKEKDFDRILLDAPCTGIGTIRKSPKTINMWNPNAMKKLVGIQKNLIKNAFDLLKPGGTMVYSTCTLEPEENEAVVDYLLENYSNAKVLPINLNIKHKDPVMEFQGKKYHESIRQTLRLWPQDNDTEGFYIAKIKKEE